jgi:hypothetical protein
MPSQLVAAVVVLLVLRLAETAVVERAVLLGVGL